MVRRRLPVKQKNQNLTPVVIVIAVVVVVVGIFIYQGVRELSGNPILKSQDDVPRVTAEEAIAAVEQGAILLDTRLISLFETSHLKGSISVPLSEIEAIMPTLDKDAWYITYCT